MSCGNRSVTFPCGIIVFCSILCLGFGLYILKDYFYKSPDDIDIKLARLEKQQAEMSVVLKNIKSQKDSPKTTTTGTRAEFRELSQYVQYRFELLETRINELEIDKYSNERIVSELRYQPEKDRDEYFSEQSLVFPAMSIMAAYNNEKGISSWGEVSERKIQQAFFENHSSNIHGGALIADCHQTTCKLNWTMSGLGSLQPEEIEEVLIIAKYELLALAVENADQVGHIFSNLSTVDDQPKITIFFRRAGL